MQGGHAIHYLRTTRLHALCAITPPTHPVGKRALLHLEGPDVLLFVGPATLEPKPHHVRACWPAIGRNEMEREVRQFAGMDLESLLLEDGGVVLLLPVDDGRVCRPFNEECPRARAHSLDRQVHGALWCE